MTKHDASMIGYALTPIIQKLQGTNINHWSVRTFCAESLMKIQADIKGIAEATTAGEVLREAYPELVTATEGLNDA